MIERIGRIDTEFETQDKSFAGPIEIAEVLFHLSEVRKQLARGGGDLKIALLDPRGVEKVKVALTSTPDFCLDVSLSPLQFGDARPRIGLGSFSQLAKQIKDCHQA